MHADARHDRRRASKLAYVGGFHEASSFNRCFRRRFGAVAEGEWRRALMRRARSGVPPQS